MKPAGHAAAAIEVLHDILAHHRPAAVALADWGRRHRFAGSKDRAHIGNLVFDVLRRRASLAWQMQDDSPRALVLAHLAFTEGLAPEAIDALGRERHGFGPLSDAEWQRLAAPVPLEKAPAWVRGNVPEWLWPSFENAFGVRALEEAAALARRAPVDIRTNILRTQRARLKAALARFDPEETPYSPWGLRFLSQKDRRLPDLESDGTFARGHFEIQDEGSQVAALLTGVKAGEQVLDLCAGGGGKTLAMAAMMNNRGQIFAFDAERQRLKPIWQRLQRAGVRNVQVIEPHKRQRLDDLAARMHCVLIDAPCSGTGTWRRHPDARWRLRPGSLEKRVQLQRTLLAQGARYVRPGGRLVYVTCSLLPEENEAMIAAFLKTNEEFTQLPWQAFWPEDWPRPESTAEARALRLTPAQHGTDGFFIAILGRKET
ncbi:RsmB/NOP family class I SAM-dependent RNA methyltransferase [Thermopetrobacter sp. TC1]|uniref:RsmB/NOP family class I SAM-dependent RNA methyltransferase n=1 Tax=Thermopetrobacter sp. TC1 TaxID=1495045 RepID=UPI00056DA309|nr:RsmB/NOP family class I SAM-dependent RNA methyltransferase [Thermopetrobacter sp. TC1]